MKELIRGFFLPMLVAAVMGGMAAYTGLTLAQNDIEDLKEEVDELSEVVDDIPVMQRDLEHIREETEDNGEKLDKLIDLVQEAVVEDTRYHHSH